MVSHRLRYRFLEFVFWVGCVGFGVGEITWAEVRDPMEPRGGTFMPPPLEEPAPWKEQAANLPPFPREEDLIEIPLERSEYRCLVDSRTLALGEDQVVRYTVVLASKMGARSIFFEGLRCGTGEYKTEAYGRDGIFQKAQAPLWRRLADMAGSLQRFRLELRTTLCDETGRPLLPADVVKHLLNRRLTN